MAKNKRKSQKDTTVEIRVPDELYKKAQSLAEADQKALEAVLQSVVGHGSKFGVKKVIVAPKDDSKLKKLKKPKLFKPC